MDNRIEIGDKLDLEKIETHLSVYPGKGTDIYVSQVLDEGQEPDRIFVAMPIKEGKVIPLSVGHGFYATFYTKSGLLRCEVEVMGRYKKDSLLLLEIEQKTGLEKVQRREYFRFECRMPIEYRVLGQEEREMLEAGNAYNADEWQLDWKKAVMLDLSGGGLRYVSGFHTEKDTMVQVRFGITIEDKTEMVYAYAWVLRSFRNQNNNTIYDHHIKFWRMDQGLREKIIRFIFHEQRKNRSKQLGME